MEELKIAVLGLGYVGLPLACLFASRYPTVGFDINPHRVDSINAGHDDSGEMSAEKLQAARDNGLACTASAPDIAASNFYIVAVPTPINAMHDPVLDPLEEASRIVGKYLKKGDYVVYESTVYPGTTEEVCIPILEAASGLKLNEDFFVGYSPERINPGDKEHTVDNIVKITSGSTPEAADFIDRVYNSVLTNGTYRAASIQIAEAAKVLENSQRDINIAFINEIAKVFNVLNINTTEVLKAAATKWNFLKFHPGLVGGHCIGVDPYYLIQRSKLKGFRPKLMSEARRINDTLGYYVAERITNEMNRRGITVRESNVLILGFSFKANCPDIRNTKVADVYKALSSFTPNVTVYDPTVCLKSVKRDYNIPVATDFDQVKGRKYDAVIQCVNHHAFDTIDIDSLISDDGFAFFVNAPERSRELTSNVLLL